MTRAARKAPTVRIHNLGCGKNAVDAEVMAGLLSEGGFLVVPGGRADAAVLNTCGFVRAAKEESIEAILSLAAEKRRGRIRRLVVAGCMARRYRDELPELLPEVDLFLGPGDIPDLPGRLASMLAADGPSPGGSAQRSLSGGGALPDEAYGHRLPEVGTGSAFLKILEGCDNRCAYCAIPAIRGPLRSRDRESLLAEARLLVRRGARELNLIGQDITAYGLDRGERGGSSPWCAPSAPSGASGGSASSIFTPPASTTGSSISCDRRRRCAATWTFPSSTSTRGSCAGWGGRTGPTPFTGCSTGSGPGFPASSCGRP